MLFYLNETSHDDSLRVDSESFKKKNNDSYESTRVFFIPTPKTTLNKQNRKSLLLMNMNSSFEEISA